MNSRYTFIGDLALPARTGCKALSCASQFLDRTKSFLTESEKQGEGSLAIADVDGSNSISCGQSSPLQILAWLPAEFQTATEEDLELEIMFSQQIAPPTVPRLWLKL